jgi:hypothetical protein
VISATCSKYDSRFKTEQKLNVKGGITMIHIYDELTQIYNQVNTNGFTVVSNSLVANEAIKALKHCYSDVEVDFAEEGIRIMRKSKLKTNQKGGEKIGPTTVSSI